MNGAGTGDDRTGEGVWRVRASLAQERVWFASELDPQAAVYNLGCPVYLPFPVSTGQVTEALSLVVGRHEALRTALEAGDGELYQLVHDRVPVEVGELDLTGLSDADQEARLAEAYEAAATEPFALDEAPLWRAVLIRLGESDNRLAFVVHHVLFDAASMVSFRAELSELCQAVVQGRAARLPELAVQYADYAAWHREQTEAGTPGLLDYWRRRLAGVPVVHQLPTDRPRTSTPDFAGGEVSFEFGTELTDALQVVARARGATPFMVLAAAFAVLLHRLTGQPDTVLAVPVAGRDHPDLAPLIGMFVNTIPVRINTGGNPPFAELVDRVRENVLDDFEHQDIPYQTLVRELAVHRDPAIPPLTQLGFNYLPHSAIGNSYGTSREELTLEASARYGRLEYSSRLFDRTTMETLAQRFVRLLGRAVAEPTTRLADLPLLSEAETTQLARFNDTGRARPGTTVLEQIIERAREAPAATAVIGEDGAVSYRQLVVDSASVAGRLRAAAVPAGSLVGVCLSRRSGLLAALLGVWRAGCAYVPLDPDYPSARLDHVVRDAGLSAVLTERDLVDRVPLPDAPVLLLDSGEPTAKAGEPLPLPRQDQPAYVIYTSGSTGRPKGVVVGHAALANLIGAFAHRLDAGPDMVWLALTSLSFDIAGLELFLPLAAGGRLVLAGDTSAKDGAALTDLARRHRVTHLQATPSGWRMLLAGDFADPTVTALVGGEALPAPLATALRPVVGSLTNVYGPTETTIWSTWWPVPDKLDEVQIGTPLDNTQAYVLDEWHNQLPVGFPGELYLAGDGLAHGYHGRPGLTADRFRPDRHGRPGGRSYRTGDRAVRRPDGSLVFLGRTDQQVKVRGHRIELTEIEGTLARHPSVREAAAAVFTDPAGGQVLTAYVVSQFSAAPDVTTLRRYLGEWLPPYELPDRFVMLDRLPLTPNGKLDRAALPEPSAADLAAHEHQPPSTPTEKMIAEAWATILGLPTVSATADFFGLGGNSIVAVQLIAAIRAASGVRLPMRAPFEAPTVTEMATMVDRLRAAGGTAAGTPAITRLAGRPTGRPRQ